MITAPSVWGKLPALAISSDIARRVTESTRGRHGSGSSCRVCPQRHRVSRSPGSGAGYIWHRRRSLTALNHPEEKHGRVDGAARRGDRDGARQGT